MTWENGPLGDQEYRGNKKQERAKEVDSLNLCA